MTAFTQERLSELFRERAQLSHALLEAQQERNSLTLEHNHLVREAREAVTDGAKHRAQLKAERKGQEAKKAENRVERLQAEVHDKEVEIADMIAALVAVAQRFPPPGTIEQLNDLLADISLRLGRIDAGIAPVTPAIDGLRDAIREEAARPAEDSAAILARMLRQLDRQPGSLRTVLSSVSQVVQLGQPGMPAVAESRSPQLSPQDMSELPENVTVLLFASEPRDRDLPELDLHKEIREISLKIQGARFSDRISLMPWVAAEPLDLIPQVNHHKPHMVQFSGHGTPEGFLMTGPRDRSELLAADRLIQMLKWSGEDLRIVFFNICDSEEHARAAAEIVEAAIGMQGKMHDGPARVFAASLYSGLAFGNSLQRAFQQACASIGDEPDSTIPQLFFRTGSDPHKVVLVRPEVTG